MHMHRDLQKVTVIAVEGRSMRGGPPGSVPAPYLLSALDLIVGAVLLLKRAAGNSMQRFPSSGSFSNRWTWTGGGRRRRDAHSDGHHAMVP